MSTALDLHPNQLAEQLTGWWVTSPPFSPAPTPGHGLGGRFFCASRAS
jgi:hypothetical protein